MRSLICVILFALCSLTQWRESTCATDTAAGRQAIVEEILFQRGQLNLVRPDGEKKDAPVVVTMSYTLRSIGKVDLETGLFETTGYLSMSWKDSRLTFRDVHNTPIRIDVDKIWTPDIELFNSAAPGMKIMLRKNQLLVYPSGEVTWVPQVYLPSVCDMTTEGAPAVLNCTLKLGSWTYSGQLIDIKVEESSVDVSSVITNPRWTLVNTTAERLSVTYACCPESYVSAMYSFHIESKGD